MKVINYKDYNFSMGTLFDLEEPATYKKKHLHGSINVPYEKMLSNYKKLLDKDKKHYFYCYKGVKSKKLISILEYYSYDVTQVKK